jgi:hypothetical protein
VSVYVRFRSPTPNARGARVGIFALANGLSAAGVLAETDAAWLRSSNDWYNAAYADPATAVPGLFDRAVNPVTECWFRSSAVELIARVGGYLELLDRYGVSWECAGSDAPGRILYEDDVQIVVAPPLDESNV